MPESVVVGGAGRERGGPQRWPAGAGEVAIGYHTDRGRAGGPKNNLARPGAVWQSRARRRGVSRAALNLNLIHSTNCTP